MYLDLSSLGLLCGKVMLVIFILLYQPPHLRYQIHLMPQPHSCFIFSFHRISLGLHSFLSWCMCCVLFGFVVCMAATATARPAWAATGTFAEEEPSGEMNLSTDLIILFVCTQGRDCLE